MAKITKRLNVKGELDFDRGVIVEFDKELGEIEHKLSDIFIEFNGLDNVILTLAHDKIIEVE